MTKHFLNLRLHQLSIIFCCFINFFNKLHNKRKIKYIYEKNIFCKFKISLLKQSFKFYSYNVRKTLDKHFYLLIMLEINILKQFQNEFP